MTGSAPTWIEQLRGRFIVFDGPDGSGKTTQFHRFVKHAGEAGLEVCEVREPGGTSIGEQIRKVLLHVDNQDMDLRCEMLLYMASRAQLVAQRIRPGLRKGQLVLADRFISSTLAYQGTAGGIPVADILRIGQIALSECWPDLVVIFDVDEATASKRMNGGRQPKAGDAVGPSLFTDLVEGRDAGYRELVRRGYLEQAQADPNRYLVIDGRGEVQAVFDTLLQSLPQRLATLPPRT